MGIIGFGMSEENTARIISLPYCMIASDGGAVEATPGMAGDPRSFGTFARAIRMYVREQKLMPLQEMIRKMTSLPADFLGLSNRGRIVERAIADLVVFDADSVTDRATYLAPGAYSNGVRYLLVNGRLVIDGGEQTDAMPGRVVRAGR